MIKPETAKTQTAIARVKITANCQHLETRQEPAPAPHALQEVCAGCGAWIRFVCSPEKLELRSKNLGRIEQLRRIAPVLNSEELEFLALAIKFKLGELSRRHQLALDGIYDRHFTDKKEQS
jgi:hypothetical protein